MASIRSGFCSVLHAHFLNANQLRRCSSPPELWHCRNNLSQEQRSAPISWSCHRIGEANLRSVIGVAQVVDTAELFCFKRHRKLSLRFLAAFLLRIDIQGQVSCPVPVPMGRLSCCACVRRMQKQGASPPCACKPTSSPPHTCHRRVR